MREENPHTYTRCGTLVVVRIWDMSYRVRCTLCGTDLSADYRSVNQAAKVCLDIADTPCTECGG